MRKLTLLILLLIGLKVSAQQTYFTPGIPPSSLSFTPTFRFKNGIVDSLNNIYISIGTKWYQVYTAAQANARFTGGGGGGFVPYIGATTTLNLGAHNFEASQGYFSGITQVVANVAVSGGTNEALYVENRITSATGATGQNVGIYVADSTGTQANIDQVDPIIAKLTHSGGGNVALYKGAELGNIFLSGTSSITKAYGVEINGQLSTGGAIAELDALHISNNIHTNITLERAIYSEDTAPSELDGPLTVGNGDPSILLTPSATLNGYNPSASGAKIGDYGFATFNSNASYTGNARPFSLTNAYNGNSFAILIGSGATTPATLNTSLGLATGTLGLILDRNGAFSLPALSSTGIVHNSSAGLFSTSLIVNADITSGTIAYSKMVGTDIPTLYTGNGSLAGNTNVGLGSNSIDWSGNNGTWALDLLWDNTPGGSLIELTAGNSADTRHSRLDISAQPGAESIELNTNNSFGVSSLRIDAVTGRTFITDVTGSLGGQYSADYTTAQRLQRLSIPSVNTVIALADSVKATISGGAVSSVFGRTGAVVAASNDYTFSQLASTPTTLSGYGITDAYPLSGNPSSFLTGNQTITFTPTGDVTGSTTGATSLTPALSIGAGKVLNSMIATGTIDLTAKVTGILPVANGGTNLSTYTTGDLPYASATNVLSKLAIGATGNPLIVIGGVPAWSNLVLTNPASAATFTLAAGKTFTNNNTLTINSTDGITMTTPTTSFTAARTDAANTFTGIQTMANITNTSTYTLNRTGLTTALSNAIQIYNTSAATAGSQVQNSPLIEFKANGWNTTPTAASNVMLAGILLEPVAGATVSSNLNVYFNDNAGGYTKRFSFGNTGNLTMNTGTLILHGYTVSTLPTGVTGMTAYVTDALTPSFGTTLVGGGAVVTKAFYNGTNWISE